MMFKLGQHSALAHLGLVKLAFNERDLRLLLNAPRFIQSMRGLGQGAHALGRVVKPHILKTLEGPAGEYLTRIPVQAGMGAIGGLGTGIIMGSEHPGEQSAWGGLMGAGTGLAVAGAPTIRNALINALKRAH